MVRKMKYLKKLYSISITVVSIIFMMNTAFASSGKVKFSGSFVRDVCALETTHFIDIPANTISQKVPFSFNFSKCDLTPDLVNVIFHDKAEEITTSNDITFKLLENEKKVIERNGKRISLPMQLIGNYTVSDQNQSRLKLVTVSYH